MKGLSPVLRIIVSAAAGVVSTALISLAAAALVHGGAVSESYLRLCSLAALFLGALVSALLASKGGGKLPAAAAANGIMAVLFLILGQLWSGSFEPGYILINSAVLAASAVAGAFICGRK